MSLNGVDYWNSSDSLDFGAFINASTARHIVIADCDTTTTTTITPKSSQVIEFGVGTYTCPGILVPDSTTEVVLGCQILGQGVGSTIIMLADDSIGDLVTQSNFATLSSAGSIYGHYQMSIEGLVLDGNKANQTSSSSYAIRIYGAGFTIRNVATTNGLSGNIWTQWARGAAKDDFVPTSWMQDTQAVMENVQASFSGGDGITLSGPTDICLIDCVSFKNPGWGINVQQGSHVHYVQSIENGSADPEHPMDHTYDTGGAVYIGGVDASITGNDLFADSGYGTGLFMDTGCAPSYISNSNFSAPTGIVLAADGSFITGCVSQTSVVGIKFVSYGGRIDVTAYGNTGPWFDFTATGGVADITWVSEDTVGSALFAGVDGTHPRGVVPLGICHISVPRAPTAWTDITGDPDYQQVTNEAIYVNGRRIAFPLDEGTVALTDLVQTFPSGTSFAQTTSGAQANVIVNQVPGDGQAVAKFQLAGVDKFIGGIQGDGSFFLYDVANGINALSVDTGGNVRLGEGSSPLTVLPNNTMLLYDVSAHTLSVGNGYTGDVSVGSGTLNIAGGIITGYTP